MIMDKQAFIQLGDKTTDGIATEHDLLLYKERIQRAARIKTIHIYNRKAFRNLATACLALIVTAFGAIFYNNHPKPSKVENRTQNGDFVSGGSKAVLLLVDGTRVLLGDADHGEIAAERGISITETTDGQLIYKANNPVLAHKRSEEAVAYHTISTPKDGQYQVSLSDGTIVWLNASSSLKFPILFTAKQQNVKLTGEAYFEVAEQRDRPFVVEAAGMKVEAIGANFNVMAYPDRQYISTMPVEGAVKVIKNKKSRILLPGEQAHVTETIQVVHANAEAIEWKRRFNRTSH